MLYILAWKLPLLYSHILSNSEKLFIQIGYSYECLLESTFTGYLLHCKGWLSVYLYPKRPCFLGCTTIDMKDAMVQLMKWTSGLLGVGISKFSPLTYAFSRMSILQSMCYGYFTFSALFGVSFLIYGIVLPVCLLKGVPVFPKVRSKFESRILIIQNILLFWHAIGYLVF